MPKEQKYSDIKHEPVPCMARRLPHRHSYPERIFLQHWQKENVRRAYLNHGLAILEGILNESMPMDLLSRQKWEFHPISQRDAEVAATVIQWLGTNCGRCFLEEVQRDIVEYRKTFCTCEYHFNRYGEHHKCCPLYFNPVPEPEELVPGAEAAR